MDDKILAVYGLSADLWHAIGRAEDPPPQRRAAAVLTTGLVARWCFRGNFEAARALWSTPRYLPHLRSRRRVNRRCHRLPELFWRRFDLLGYTGKQRNTEAVDVMDSFPVAVCDKYRIPRAQVYPHEEYRGGMAGKTRDCYGLKVPLLVTNDGQPVEWFLTPGS